MKTAAEQAREAIFDFRAIVADSERVLDDTGGETTPDFDCLEALAEQTLEYALEQIGMARKELRAKAEANKAMADYYRDRADSYKAQAAMWEGRALDLMREADVTKVRTSTGSVSRQEYYKTEVDEHDDEAMQQLFDQCLCARAWKPDKTEIGKLLKQGKAVPGARRVVSREGVTWR